MINDSQLKISSIRYNESMSAQIKIPLDVPDVHRFDYEANYNLLTQESGRVILFAGDQKVEHLNDDFVGEGISPEDADPIHLFEIASKASSTAFATHFGLITKYGEDYPDIPYVIKLNSKTDLLTIDIADPVSLSWHQIKHVIQLKRQIGLHIPAVAYTLYLGSEHENQMLVEAANIVHEAHENGLIAILFIYPRGKSIENKTDPVLIAGMAGVGAALGADFIKIEMPEGDESNRYLDLKTVVKAAGRTQVLISGGSHVDSKDLLNHVYKQLHIGGTSGIAIGRNLHQRSLDEAVRLSDALHSLVIKNEPLEQALSKLV